MVVSLRRRGRLACALGLLIGCTPDAPSSIDPAPRVAAPLPADAPPLAVAIALGTAPVAVDDATGLPRLLRATTTSARASVRGHLERLAPAWGVRADRLPGLADVAVVPVLGGTITRLRQLVDGMPVDRRDLRVMVGANGELHAVAGTLYGSDAPRTAARFLDADAASAIARALRHAYGRAFDATSLTAKRAHFVAGAANGVVVELARATRVWHPLAGTRTLVAAWVVEAYASDGATTSGDAFRTVLAAADGHVLEHRSLVADGATTYRVFADATGHPLDGPTADFTPHPAGTPNGAFPPYVAPRLVTVDPADPWLPAGATATTGNNTDAYADLAAPDGLSAGDFRATTTSVATFDRVYDTALAPMANAAQQQAAITSLFYNINWQHDFWYAAGFTEAAGNAQADNYGRGGEAGDALLAEAQDSAPAGVRNNANMSTPGDGMPPRMQVYLWSGAIEKSLRLTPSGRTPPIGHANFGPLDFDVTGNVQLASDSGGASVTDGCEPFSAVGRIALVDRGNCNFTVKATNAQQGGALGVIVANNVAGSTPQSPLGGTDPAVTIPMVSVTLDEGTAIKGELASGVTARLQRATGVDLDGSLDSTLVAHELGHYLHHRLSDCGTRWCGAISEGWGDFVALLTTVRAGDDLQGAYPFSVYTTQSFTDDAGYFGIRRAPYSADLAKNSLSFRHMADDEPLPTTHPFLGAANNAEVHNAGEIWAAALWEGYVALQGAGASPSPSPSPSTSPSFDEVHRKMARYVVAGLLLTPPDVTPTEARDAILAAVLPASRADHDLLAEAFARRGFGSCAVSPGPTSTDFKGIVESAAVQGRVLPSLVTFDDTVRSCDGDGVLDARERGRLTLPLSNASARDLADVTVAITSTTPGLTIATPALAIPSLPAYATTTIEVEVALDESATAPISGALTVTITAPGACDETLEIPVPARMHVDDVPMRATTELFDATTTWSAEDGLWRQRYPLALDGYMHGPVPATLADASLESPLLQLGSEPVRVELLHRYDFELAEGTFWDGGVVEYTTDGGVTWADVATLPGVTPGYSGTLASTAGNPLAGRAAYGGRNAAYPERDLVTLELGTALANQNVALRFRIGSDRAVGSTGWEVHEVRITGLVNTPFPVQEGDDFAGCEAGGDAGTGPDGGTGAPNEGDGGGCCSADREATGSGLGLAIGVLALLRRRRRRRR